MKKKIILIIIMFMILFPNIANAEDENEVNTNDIIETQTKSLDISSFLKEADNYTTDVLEDIDISTVLSEALKGNIDTGSIGKKILERFFKEILTAIASIGSIVIIVIIHSVLKSISDGLENGSTSQITYYVTYILIVTIVMKNFADIITMVKDSIESLVGFTNCLLPILMTLMLATGSITSATMLEPMILFIITLVGNIITRIIIPLALISIALNVISNVSDKVQIGNLAKYINSTTIWILGIILTIFVGVSSLEGTITSGVDGLTAKTAKTAVSTVIPVVGKILRGCCGDSAGVHKCIKKCSRNSWNNNSYWNLHKSNIKITVTYGGLLYRSRNL